MNRMLRLALVSVAVLLGLSAHAADRQKLTVGVAHTDFSGAFGSRNMVDAEYVNVLGADTYVINMAQGERDYDGAISKSFNGNSVSGTFYRDWSPLYSTRSNLAFASDSPVFARRVYDQDITYKGLANTALTAGAKHAEYFGGVEANAWYLAGAYYLERFVTAYRYTHYNLSGVGDSYGMTLMLQLQDQAGGGSSQLWLGKGTSIQESTWSPVALSGQVKTVALRRTQPLSKQLALNVSVEQAWYDTPVVDYSGVTGQMSLSYTW